MRWISLFKQLPDASVYAILLALCVPAFWVNLHLMPFIGDEGIRSGVALEMHLSGDYLVPTLNGEPYFNKPPLYNWILLGARQVFGYFGEWPARNTTLLFLFLFAGTAWLHVRRELGSQPAVLAFFMALTSGRILFWDSMLGLIDICFSFLVYLNWMLWYHWGKKGWFWRVFIASYALTAACFLLKGLPAAVFQAISVPAALVLLGQWKRLFSLPHFVGILVGLALSGAYYLVYAQQISLEKAFAILLDQSLQRTVTHFGLGQTILHLFTFPFEQVYHFLPWSLLLILVAHRGFWGWVNANPFVRFNFWLMVVNLPVYWTSVQVYPRYLLMFVPLFNLVFWYVYQRVQEGDKRLLKLLFSLFAGIAVALVLAVAGLPFIARLHQLDHFYIAWLLTLLPAVLMAWALLTDPRRQLLWMAGVVLVVRIGLNLFVIPFRTEEAAFGYSREDAARIARNFPNEAICQHRGSVSDNVLRFYLENALQQIVPFCDAPPKTGLFLVEDKYLKQFEGAVVDSLCNFTTQKMYVLKPEMKE